MPHLVDLSHIVTDGLETYPGMPVPQVFEHLGREAAERFYGPGVTFQVGMITMCTNTGTYLDTPFHRFADGHDLTGLALERVAQVDAVCIDCTATPVIEPSALDGLDLAGRAVLFHTGHSRRWGTPAYFTGHPYVSAATARALVAAGVAVVGIDSLNIDATHSPDGDGRPVHTTLLGAGIPIVEHLTHLDELPADGFTFTAVPPKIEGLGTFTVRAHAMVRGGRSASTLR
jgi:kynurenine formamidase